MSEPGVLEARLVEAGLPPVDVDATLQTVSSDARLRLVVYTGRAEPRIGDRIRVGRGAAMEVLVAVPGYPGKWALIGLPIDARDAEGSVKGLF